jgi:alkylation response protein AidB-like acyl-CoA dehydrogenase
MTTTSKEQWIKLVHQLGPDFEHSASLHDREDTFVAENYTALKQHRFLAATIPSELGGGGLSHSGMGEVLRTLAQYCGSTALALSMHQHLLAANIWKFRRGQGGEELLQRVAAQQPVLVSTGARDWLESNGEMVACADGFRVKAMKFFASQSAIGQGFYRSFGLERLFRDVQGARYHPLPEKEQQQFCGEYWLRNAA